MFHTYTVFITQSIVPRPLDYDKYLALSCKSHTLSHIIINVIFITCCTSKMPMHSTEHQDDRGEALFAIVESVWVSFCKISIFPSYPSDINRMAYIAGWQAHHHHQICFLWEWRNMYKL